MNAAEELLKHIGDRTVKYIQIDYDDWVNPEEISGTLEQVLPRLNFSYDRGYGHQYIFGTIWYTDGTWSERGEYDGSEWWSYRKCPPLPEVALEPDIDMGVVCVGCGNAVDVDSGLVISQGGYGVTVHSSICEYGREVGKP
jgi:hypothetical protein